MAIETVPAGNASGSQTEKDMIIPADLQSLQKYLLEQVPQSEPNNKSASASIALNGYMAKVQNEILPLRLEFNALLKQMAHLDNPQESGKQKYLALKARLVTVTTKINDLSQEFKKLQPLLYILKNNQKILETPNSYYILETLDQLPQPEIKVPLPKQFQPKIINTLPNAVSNSTGVNTAVSSAQKATKSPVNSVNSPSTPATAKTPGSVAASNTVKHSLQGNLASASTFSGIRKNAKGSGANAHASSGSVKKPATNSKRGTPQAFSPLSANTPVTNVSASNNSTNLSNIGAVYNSGGRSKNHDQVTSAPLSKANSANESPSMYMNTSNITPANILQNLNSSMGNNSQSSNMGALSSRVGMNGPSGNIGQQRVNNPNSNSNSNNINNNSMNYGNNMNNRVPSTDNSMGGYGYNGNFSMSPSSILQNMNNLPNNNSSVASGNMSPNGSLNTNNNSAGMLDLNTLDLSNLDDFLQ
ncbi:hypothetical protein ACO0RG_003960 [Hanseniaspora osmophila]|uniref:Uncharacterized protein n=1 Tax=Hanseniaspora osmophila TaxID=56408 RepID=A0A1E5RAI1_9ASCO|nr:hypothetical protein AWRI3579_g2595 [Hanseniaspora osmophila]